MNSMTRPPQPTGTHEMHPPLARGGLLLGGVLAVWLLQTSGYGADLGYNRDIRPILVENCFSCHGADSASRQADLRLDQRDAAVDRKAILPGQPSESEMIRRILSDDPDAVMPPPQSHKNLKPAEKEKLAQWIAQGATYEPHWSFIPPRRGELPAVEQSGWVRNPIDRFVLAKLEELGLEPAPEADRSTLVRRLALDLTGLPPAPELVNEFVSSTDPDAYNKLVERLLEQPQWGEHRARYWLDAARYADTHGIHFDNYREMWTYRDWVIDAFNRNLPFDQFTIEQLAGDLLPNATRDQQVATGFNRCNITTNEGGIIDEEYLVLYTRDRTETTSAVWMGLTTGCAVCHDHKFDPISQKEFYSLAAFFNNTTQPAKDGNIKDSPPILMIPRPEDDARWQAIGPELDQARAQVTSTQASAKPVFDEWAKTTTPDVVAASLPSEGLQFALAASSGAAQELAGTFQGNAIQLSAKSPLEWKPGPAGQQALYFGQPGSVEHPDAGRFDKDQPFTVAAWVMLPANDSSGAILARMDDQHDYRGWDLWVEGRRIGMHIIHKWQEDALKVVSNKPIKANEWTHVLVSYDGSAKAAGVKVFINGVAEPTNVQADALKSTTITDVPLKLGQRHASSPLTGASVTDVRLYERALNPGEVTTLANGSKIAGLLAIASDQRTPAQAKELFDWWLQTSHAPYQEATRLVQSLEAEQAGIKARGTVAHVMNEQRDKSPMAFVLFRGEYDKRRDEVPAATPAILPSFPAEAPRNRLGLAQWLLAPEHPLTARVTVNRFWQEVFGTGLVRTSGDFGLTGELPSHPELLDWLAIEFREKNWDVKQFFRLLVTSATYRQAAVTTPAKLEKDPANRFLSRGPRFRMDAEMVRDHALAASGILVPKIGGPSVKPYQPDGVWEAVAMIGSNTRNYQRDTGENLYRRSLYTFWKRSAPPASMDILNAPAREVCTVRRERTNTPLQALVTLNDPQFVEAARFLAQKTLEGPLKDDEARLQAIAERVRSRAWTTTELDVLRQSLDALRDHYTDHPAEASELLKVGEAPIAPSLPAVELATWTMLINEVMNLDEVLCK